MSAEAATKLGGTARLVSLARLRACLLESVRSLYRTDRILEIRAPVVVSFTGACENVETVIRLQSDQNMVLTQTGQLALEHALEGHPAVWCHTGSYRGEIEDQRHLIEFELIEEEVSANYSTIPPEVTSRGYAPELMFDALIARIADIVRGMIQAAIASCSAEIDVLGGRVSRLAPLLDGEFARISYREALEILSRAGREVTWGSDLTAGEEALLLESLEKAAGRPQAVFVTHYPEDIKFFNMRLDQNKKNVVQSADLLLPGIGEAVGAAVREDDYILLRERFERLMLPRLTEVVTAAEAESMFERYFDAVRSGRIGPHAGYGIGLERVIASILGESDIRKVSMPWLLRNA